MFFRPIVVVQATFFEATNDQGQVLLRPGQLLFRPIMLCRPRFLGLESLHRTPHAPGLHKMSRGPKCVSVLCQAEHQTQDKLTKTMKRPKTCEKRVRKGKTKREMLAPTRTALSRTAHPQSERHPHKPPPTWTAPHSEPTQHGTPRPTRSIETALYQLPRRTTGNVATELSSRRRAMPRAQARFLTLGATRRHQRSLSIASGESWECRRRESYGGDGRLGPSAGRPSCG